MKKIGLVGGTGPESTAMYYRELNMQIDEATNGRAMPDLAIESVNFRRQWEYVVGNRNDEMAEYLAEKVKNLQKVGSQVIALTAVTVHMVADEIETKTGVKLVRIPEAVAEEAATRGYKKVGLLGTTFTMENDYMKKAFRSAGIAVAVPDKADRDFVANRIMEELERGIVTESTRQRFNAVIAKLRDEERIEAVVLGCTELPLLLNDENCILPCLDSVSIHIKKLIAAAME